MKKFLVIVIALLAAGGSAYYLFEKGMDLAEPMQGAMSSSASSDMKQLVDTFMPENGKSASSEDTLLVDAGLASSSSSSVSSSSSSKAAMAKVGAYADYKDGVLGNGETSMLFFHDKTQAASKTTDAAIKALYKSGSATVTTYRVDIDGYASLKTKYDVTAGNTVVLVDGKGKALKTVPGPSADDLADLLK